MRKLDKDEILILYDADEFVEATFSNAKQAANYLQITVGSAYSYLSRGQTLRDGKRLLWVEA